MFARNLKCDVFWLLSRPLISRSESYVCIASNALCTAVDSTNPDFNESPDLPSMFKSPGISDDDDFVIPSLAGWIESHKVVKHSNKPFLDVSTKKSDTDKMNEVLQKYYTSSDSIVQDLTGSGIAVSDSLVEKLLKRYSNDWISAFGVFSWAKSQTDYKLSPELYNVMVDNLGKCRKFNLMWDLLKEMKELEGYITLHTMTKVMRRLTKARMYKEAIEVFRGVDDFGVEKNITAFHSLIDTLIKEGSVEHAYEVFLEFKDLLPINLCTFNVLMHGWCKARKIDEAKKMMKEMESRGICPDEITYTCFIETYCREKDFQKVNAILNEMQEKGCKPSIISYTILMHAFGKAKQIKDALNIYEKVKKDCVPDSMFYSSLIFILSKVGRFKDANEIFEDMKKQGVKRDVTSYTTMINAFCEQFQEEKALKLLQQMETDSCKPDIKTYAPLLKMCCRKKRMKILDFLLSHMFKNNVSMDLGTYTLLINWLCKSKKYEQACVFFEEAVSKGMVPYDSTCKMLMTELEKQSNMVKEKENVEKLMLHRAC